MVERPVQLHVAHPGPHRAAEGVQRADLVHHVGADLRGRRREVAPPEARQVAVAGVRPDGDPAPGGRRDGALHDHRIAGVKAARHVGRRHQAEQLLLSGQLVASEALADVGVEIDAGHAGGAGRTVSGWLILKRKVCSTS